MTDFLSTKGAIAIMCCAIIAHMGDDGAAHDGDRALGAQKIGHGRSPWPVGADDPFIGPPV